MSSSNRRYQAAQGYILPTPAAKELLLRNAREDSELDNRRKQLDKERKELESHFSKARCRLLFRSNLSSQCQAVEFGVGHNSSDMKEDFEVVCGVCDNVTICSASSLELGFAHSLNHSSEMEEELRNVPNQRLGQQGISHQSAICDLNGKDRCKVRNKLDQNNEFSLSQSVPESRSINFDATLNNTGTSNSFASCNLLPKRKLGLSCGGLENCNQNSEFSLNSADSTKELAPSNSTQRHKINWHGRMNKNDLMCGTALSEKQHGQAKSDTRKSDKWETRSEYSSCQSFIPRRKLSWAGKMDKYDSTSASSKKQSGGKGSQEGKQDNSDVKSEYSSNPPPRRKIRWNGKMPPEKSETGDEFAFSNLLRRRKKSLSWGEAEWETQSQISQPRSERNAVIKAHSVLRRSHSYTKNRTEVALTKESLQNLRYSTSMQRARRPDLVPDLNLTARYEDGKRPVEKPLSEILPPITLPPIYLQETNSRRKKAGNIKSKMNMSSNCTHDSGSDQSSSVDDLANCRYLRIRGTTNSP